MGITYLKKAARTAETETANARRFHRPDVDMPSPVVLEVHEGIGDGERDLVA